MRKELMFYTFPALKLPELLLVTASFAPFLIHPLSASLPLNLYSKTTAIGRHEEC